MKTKLFVLFFLLGTVALFAGPRVAIGIGIGGHGYGPAYYVPAPPPPPPAYYYARPPYPGPSYTWITGYYYPVGPRWHWRPGYWARRPYAGARWVAPRYYNRHYYGGHWRRW